MFELLQKVPLFTLVLLFAVVAADQAATAQRGSLAVAASIEVDPSGLAGAGIAAALSDPQVQRLSTDVRITVEGGQRVARVEVEERFRNNGGRLAEGDYLYPIPAGAVFTNLSLFMGEQELRGEMMPAAEARGIYEEIVRRKKDPALVELIGHGLLRARVFPIAAGETRRIILRYTMVLGRDGHLVRLRYPRTVGMFDGPELTPRPVQEERLPLIVRPTPAPFTLSIRVTDAGLFATPYSPTHRIEVRERGANELDIDHDSAGEPERDFELFLPLRETAVGASVVTHVPVGDDGFYMLLLSPPVDDEPAGIPRDVTLVLDVSGSMSGDKIAQARAALDQMLAGLREDDRFRLITFASVVRPFRGGWSVASRDEVAAARDWLARVQADGSTNIEGALREALGAETPAAGRMAQIVFLTDGQPTVGETSAERIAAMAADLLDDERIFGFGVGHDVNTYLLDSLAAGGRGTVSYVGPGENVEEAVSSLTRKISRPALSDLRIVEAPVMLEDGYPQDLPDLFYGEDLMLLGRYRAAGAGALVLEGTRNGRAERLRFDVDFAAEEPGNEFIVKLWAARKAAALTTQVRLRGADPKLVEEIRQLGLRYGVLTDYTAYLVQEPGMSLNDATLRQVMDRAQAMEVDADRQVGREAFARARRDAAAKAATSVEEAITVTGMSPVVGAPASGAQPATPAEAGAAGPGNELAAAGEGATRHVVDRMFVMRAGVWTDLRFSEQTVVKVAPFSAAYFTLLERLPQIKPFVALGSRVIIAADGLAVELDESGLTEWTGDRLDAVLRAFGK